MRGQSAATAGSAAVGRRLNSGRSLHGGSDEMGLSAGYYFGLTASRLKALRALKGDPPRRQFIEGLKGSHDRGWRLKLGDAWSFLQHLFDPENYPAMPVGHLLCLGRSLHKGQFSRIELLPSANLSAMAEVLRRVDEP